MSSSAETARRPKLSFQPRVVLIVLRLLIVIAAEETTSVATLDPGANSARNLMMFLKNTFESDEHRARVCKILCEYVSLPGLWTAAYGPTDRARELKEDCAGLSAAQTLFFLAAWAIWDGTSSKTKFIGGVRLLDLFGLLDPENLGFLGTLFTAIGDSAVDDWIERHDRGVMPRI